jgi:hypothetical protein
MTSFPDALDLLRDHISGLIELDMLACLRSDATKGLTASVVAELVGLPEEWIEDSLAALRTAGLVVEDRSGAEPRFLYHPATPALEAAVATLAQVYAERPAYVARILNEDALSRVRWSASQAFPAAFVVGGGRTDGSAHPAAPEDET